MEEATDDPVEREWRLLCERWDEDGAHKRFLAICASLDRLADASARYRAVRETNPDPARQRGAAAQTERILGLAMQRLELARTPKREPRKSAKLLLVAVAVAGAVIGMSLYLMSRMLLRSP